MAQEIEEQLFVGEVALKAFIGYGDKVLLSRDVGMTNWDSPGGRMHIGEMPRAALEREIREEIGVDAEIGEPFDTAVIIPVHSNKSKRPRFLVAYRAALKDLSAPFVLAADEIEEVRWFSKEEAAVLPVWDEYRHILKTFFEKKEETS